MTSNFCSCLHHFSRGNRIWDVTDVYLHIRLARNRYMENTLPLPYFLLSITIQAKR